MVRRVNIRQVMPFEGTRAYTETTLGKHDRRFKSFKEFVRQKIDFVMLKRVFPAGTVLRDVRIEIPGELSFGRQPGSYPILAGIPANLQKGTVIDVVVVDWGMRSLTALPLPLNVNTMTAPVLRWMPGVGKKRVAAVISKRPFKDVAAFVKVVGSSELDPYLTV
jgi:radical SAM superfamily enzyme with C-terminal helix-hairpin-helix motif